MSGVPDFAPGTNFKYSTSNYALAALIIQTVTGHPVEQELHARIWDPLGMKHTYFGGFETYNEARSGVWWDFENGLQNYSNNPQTSMLTYGYGGANIVSTPQDLALFARALLTGSLLTQNSLAQMKAISANSFAYWAGYGLGLHHAMAYSSANMFGHDGFYTNLSDMFHSYDFGFTLVTMTNTQTQSFGIFNQMYNAIRTFIKTVGISENTFSSSIKLFPNPTESKLTISLGKPIEEAKLEVMDFTGKVVYTRNARFMETIEINTKEFAEGIYVVEIQGLDFIGSKKIIVAR